MPGTDEEYVEWSARPDDPGRWRDGTTPTDAERADLAALRAYRERLQSRRRARGPQLRAMRLLRRFLTPEQRDQFRRRRSFLVTAASGHSYRIEPRSGRTERVTRHGRRWFAALSFCLHDDRSDPASAMPPADLSLAHLLLLTADEAEFLRTANVRDVRDQLWNREYLRRVRSRRVAEEREARP